MAEKEANNQNEELTGGLAGFKKISNRYGGSNSVACISIGNSETANAHVSKGAIALLGKLESQWKFDYCYNWDTKEVALVFSAEGSYIVGKTGTMSAAPLLRLGAVRGDRFVVERLPGDAALGLVFKLDNLKNPGAQE